MDTWPLFDSSLSLLVRLKMSQKAALILENLRVLDLTRGFAAGVATLHGFTFVVALFTFTNGDDDFDEFSGRQKFRRHDAHALLFLGGKMTQPSAL